MKEIWKDIPGYEGLYQVSNKGQVKRLKGFHCLKEKIMKQKLHCPEKDNSYLSIRLCKNSKHKNFLVHRLIMLAFKGASNLDVNHKNGIKSDNRLENLEYCTRKQNINHGFKIGLCNKTLKVLKKANEKRKKKVIQLDENKNILNIYESISEAGRQTNTHHQNISACLRKIHKTAGGYYWQYKGA